MLKELQELHILLVDENQLETNKTALSTLSIPLFPLTRNQKIMRTFPLATVINTLFSDNKGVDLG